MFPLSSFTAASEISAFPLEVTTCKFRILDAGDVSRLIKRFGETPQQAREVLVFKKKKHVSRGDPSRDPQEPTEIGYGSTELTSSAFSPNHLREKLATFRRRSRMSSPFEVS